MPKPKPDQVIRHEIVLGRSERELVEGALVAYQVNRIATPTVALLSDASAMFLILTALATYLGFKFEVGSLIMDSTQDLFTAFLAQYDAYKETPEYQATVIGGTAVAGAIPVLGTPLQILIRQIFG